VEVAAAVGDLGVRAATHGTLVARWQPKSRCKLEGQNREHPLTCVYAVERVTRIELALSAWNLCDTWTH
jgi:hypothetical protein